jgi:hypothetical protein
MQGQEQKREATAIASSGIRKARSNVEPPTNAGHIRLVELQ